MTMREFTVEHGNSRVFGKIAFPEGEGPWPAVIFSHGFRASPPAVHERALGLAIRFFMAHIQNPFHD